ncbi:hypothetical protein ACH47Z_39885 [Streptomyces sp. NPDC020192]|uniref:hypothetical protein n=1 Tax=Streptomyces sp. NPDC020192 TaxID=3365066 RepID=UPI00378E7E24
MTTSVVAGLDDTSLILALQEVTEDLTADGSPHALPMDQDEAWELLLALLREGGYSGAELAELDRPGQYAAARRVLVELVEDPAIRDAAGPVLADPPSDTRLGADLAGPALAAVAGTVAWPQTKVDVRIKRKDGKTEFEFRVVKESAPAKSVRQGLWWCLWPGMHIARRGLSVSISNPTRAAGSLGYHHGHQSFRPDAARRDSGSTTGHHQLLVRRNRTTGELAYCRCHSTTSAPLATLVKVAGSRCSKVRTGWPDWMGTRSAATLPGPTGSPSQRWPMPSSPSSAPTNTHTAPCRAPRSR